MESKKTHLLLTSEEVEFSRLFFEWAEIWYSDEATIEESNKAYRAFLKKHKKIKRRLNPNTVRKLLNSYSNFCDVVREVSKDTEKKSKE